MLFSNASGIAVPKNVVLSTRFTCENELFFISLYVTLLHLNSFWFCIELVGF